MNDKGMKITVPARVVKVREKGKRLVSFQDTSIEDDVLHITDIREYTELPASEVRYPPDLALKPIGEVVDAPLRWLGHFDAEFESAAAED